MIDSTIYGRAAGQTNILHINSYYGTSPFYRDFYEAQRASGDFLRVFTPLPKNFDLSARDFGSYTDALKILGKIDRLFFHYRYEKAYRVAESRYKGQPFDLLHAHSLFSNGYVARKLGKAMHRPYIVAVRDTDVNVFFAKMPHLRALGRAILREAAGVVFLSPAYRDEALKPYLSQAEFDAVLRKSTVLPNGVDPFWLQNKNAPKETPEGAIKFLSVGQITRRKNIPVAAEAVRLLNEDGVKAELTVVGRPVDQKLASRLLASPNVRVLPPRPLKELLPVYREADVFVLPSIRETFGLVYAEAMTQGLPVLYSRGQGFCGQFEEGAVGYMVDPRSPEDVARRARDILENYKALSERCVLNCARFDWSRIAKLYQAFYKRATNPLIRKPNV